MNSDEAYVIANVKKENRNITTPTIVQYGSEFVYLKPDGESRLVSDLKICEQESNERRKYFKEALKPDFIDRLSRLIPIKDEDIQIVGSTHWGVAEPESDLDIRLNLTGIKHDMYDIVKKEIEEIKSDLKKSRSPYAVDLWFSNQTNKNQQDVPSPDFTNNAQQLIP